jgi:hypothetical protein
MNSHSLLFEDVSPAEAALESWRSAEALVRVRWRQFLAADGSARPTTFAAYVAALDIEAAAAAELRALSRSE